MNDNKLVRLLKKSDEQALECVISIYAAYVSTVISNQLGAFSEEPVLEELTSDVFFALWKNRQSLTTSHLRGWLGAAARNRAKNYIRARNISYEGLEEDCIICSEDNLFDTLEQHEQQRIIHSALLDIKPEEREVIIRYYYYNQTVGKISEETSLNRETVKSRLRRGREKLKSILVKGGCFL